MSSLETQPKSCAVGLERGFYAKLLMISAIRFQETSAAKKMFMRVSSLSRPLTQQYVPIAQAAPFINNNPSNGVGAAINANFTSGFASFTP